MPRSSPGSPARGNRWSSPWTTSSPRATRDGGDPHLRGGLLSCHRRAVRPEGGRGAAPAPVSATRTARPASSRRRGRVNGPGAGRREEDHRPPRRADAGRLRAPEDHPPSRLAVPPPDVGTAAQPRPYDAAYIALAEALGCELLTGD